MSPSAGIILCLAYIVGLLATSVPWGGWGLLILGCILAVILPQFWRTRLPFWVWLVAGAIAFLATFYFQFRVPQPAANDIGQFIANSGGNGKIVTVTGKVISSPRLTRSGKVQFELAATQLTGDRGNQNVSGKLYVTVPLLQGTGLHPGREIPVRGTLYDPKPASNPGSFDFANYLADRGIFAGIQGIEIQWQQASEKSEWGLWWIRERIVRSQIHFLGSPTGQLVSAMVLGGKSVDLPYDIRDRFVTVGLAHALAASGFQVTLILGVVLALTQRLPEGWQFGIGTGTLAVYAGLAGLQASVLRAVLMGFAGLIALVLQRKTKPLGVLLFAAILLLLFNPLWIWDLGFQFSFLATLGLIIMAQPLTERLDWLPPAIASAIAVPVAATIWTLPLQLYTFNVFSTYSLLVNLIVTPFLSLISIGSFISAIAALIYPIAGSGFAWLLKYPTQGLIAIVQFFSKLPGNNFAVGSISVWQLWILYGLIGVVWLYFSWKSGERQRNKSPILGFVFLLAIALAVIIVPAWQVRQNTQQVTVFDEQSTLLLVLRDRASIFLVNSGDEDTIQFNLLPFLNSQGINKIDAALTTNLELESNRGWLSLVQTLPVRALNYDATLEPVATNMTSTLKALREGKTALVPLNEQQGKTVGKITFKLIKAGIPAWQLQLGDRTWLTIDKLQPQQQTQLINSGKLAQIQILCWSGESLNTKLLDILKPEVAIAFSNTLDEATAKYLNDRDIRVFWTRRDGAVQWKSDGEFAATLDVTDGNFNRNSF
ncbi:MAG TPA: ComEC/Rec2 family competence protein [Oscillatoriales cyanobacterium M4454_W2019_049]|nr:ComEC/Rec2 family competence protein [Oscillatoriales cyanobacterium M4454_W2019_049]